MAEATERQAGDQADAVVRLPADWPRWPEPLGPGWIALPPPFGQVHRDLIGPCSCGRSDRVMYVYTHKERRKDGAEQDRWSVRTAVACPACLPPPDGSIVVGTFDTATGVAALTRSQP